MAAYFNWIVLFASFALAASMATLGALLALPSRNWLMVIATAVAVVFLGYSLAIFIISFQSCVISGSSIICIEH